MIFTNTMLLTGWGIICKDIYKFIENKIYGPKPIAAYVYIYDGNIEIITKRYRTYNEFPKVYMPCTTYNGLIVNKGKLLSEPIKYNDMRHISKSYYVKITTNIPNYLNYDETNNPCNGFSWCAHGNTIFKNKHDNKIEDLPDHGIINIKFYSDKNRNQCFHEGWSISVKKIKEINTLCKEN